MSIYKPLPITLSDQAVIKVPPRATLPSKYPPVYIGPKFGPSSDPSAPRIENFNPPVYQPDMDTIPISYIYNQGSSNIPQVCPLVPILLRNEWETMNTTNAKVWGGYDMYSVANIPSCSERSGGHMNFYDSMNPFSRVMVSAYENTPVIIDSHY